MTDHELTRPQWPRAQGTTFGYMLGRVIRAEVEALEEAGADSLWVGGHISSPNPGAEAVTSLAHLACVSSRAAVGTAVLLLPLYPPALAAKQFAEVDRISGGRVVMGVGVGGEYATDYSACQVPRGERGRRMDEAIPLVHELWNGNQVTNDGPFYPMTDVRIHPRPVQVGGPPILVAGRKGRTIARAATLGDGWLPYQYSPRRYHDSVTEISACAAEAGRDLEGFVWGLWTYINVRPDGKDARRETFEFMARYGHVSDERIVDHITVSGTPTEAIARLREFMDAGVEHFVFAPLGADTGVDPRLFIQREVVPSLLDS
jgi:alkanesulfonate monooxygenase SsuD/methylene tetrahydromethanopterin reductase-like flavin-dependent oxidoreductase (luciferase family)